MRGSGQPAADHERPRTETMRFEKEPRANHEHQACDEDECRREVAMVESVRSRVSDEADDRRQRHHRPLQALVAEMLKSDKRQRGDRERQDRAVHRARTRRHDANAIPGLPVRV